MAGDKYIIELDTVSSLFEVEVTIVGVPGKDGTTGGVASVNGVLPDINGNVVITIPTKISDLTNDSDFVEDADYNHTDNNYTDTDASNSHAPGSDNQVADGVTITGTGTLLDPFVAVQVQSDWNQTTNTAADYIKNKPDVENIWIKTTATVAVADWTSNAATVTVTGATNMANVKMYPPTTRADKLLLGTNQITFDSHTGTTVTLSNTTNPTTDLVFLVEYQET